MAIGAYGNDDGGDWSGKVIVMRWYGNSSSGWWHGLGNSIIGDLENTYHGQVVSLSEHGDILAVGAEGVNNFAGRVRIYNFNGGSYVPYGDILGDADYQFTGRSISISADARQIVVGAFGANSNAGRIRAYTVKYCGIANPYCDQGKYFNNIGDVLPRDRCTNCPVGSYGNTKLHSIGSPYYGKPYRTRFGIDIECGTCDVGKTTATDGSTSADDCKTGPELLSTCLDSYSQEELVSHYVSRNFETCS